MALKVGDLAPDFELPAVEGDQRLNIKLSDFRGKKECGRVVSSAELDSDLQRTIACIRLRPREVCRAQCSTSGYQRRLGLQSYGLAKARNWRNAFPHVFGHLSSCRGHASIRHFARGTATSRNQREGSIHRG